MTRPSAGLPPSARSVFISDLHLGCRYAQAQPLLSFLESIEPEYLYLVGDIIDGWQLRRKWHWNPIYSRVLKRLLELGRRGTRVRYTPGNHDECFRDFICDLGFVEIADSFRHRAADGKEYLVLHGDRFDDVERRAPWLSLVGSFAYDLLVWADYHVNHVQRALRREPWALSAGVKVRVKQAVAFASHFEQRLAEEGRRLGCDGVICGHIHMPTESRRFDIAYYNTGDWVEHRTAVYEHATGTLAVAHLPATSSLASARNGTRAAVTPTAPGRPADWRPGRAAAVEAELTG